MASTFASDVAASSESLAVVAESLATAVVALREGIEPLKRASSMPLSGSDVIKALGWWREAADYEEAAVRLLERVSLLVGAQAAFVQRASKPCASCGVRDEVAAAAFAKVADAAYRAEMALRDLDGGRS